MPSHKFQNKQVQSQNVKIMKKSLKDELLKWICEKHATNSPLDRKLLRNKALQISQSLGLTNFKCSEQWVTTFLKKYGFSTTLTTCTGPCFKDYHLWIDLMRTVLTQYRYKDIFHVDELTMYSDIFPMKINSNLKENGKDSQIINATNLISILFCCNASGTDKLPPLISGPYKSSIFREDCRYCYNEDSCISDEVFADWLLSLNYMMTQQNRKILLLLHRHRIRALGNTQLSNVKLIFFPAGFPPHLRPLRRDIFTSTKMKYRLRYAEKILQPGSKWGLDEMINAILKSWSEVPRELIVSSFQRTTFRSDDSLLEISSADWDKLSTGISFRNLITFDDHLSDIPNSIIDDGRHSIKGKHSYNLRTCTPEVFQVEESDEIWKLKDTFKEKYRLKTESNLLILVPKEDSGVSNVENVNLTQHENFHKDENCSVTLDQEAKFDVNLRIKENVLMNLKNNDEVINTPRIQEDIPIFGPESSDLLSSTNKDVVDPITFILGEAVNRVLETNTDNTGNILISSIDRNQGIEEINCHQTREGGVDKQIDQEQVDSLSQLQMEQFEDINANCNRSTTPSRKRNNFILEDHGDGTPIKVQRTENDWSKQYENNYVFGSHQKNTPGTSTQNIDDEIIVDFCETKDSKMRAKNTKNSGAEFIFTVTGTVNDPSCSPKKNKG